MEGFPFQLLPRTADLLFVVLLAKIVVAGIVIIAAVIVLLGIYIVIADAVPDVGQTTAPVEISTIRHDDPRHVMLLLLMLLLAILQTMLLLNDRRWLRSTLGASPIEHTRNAALGPAQVKAIVTTSRNAGRIAR